MIQRFPFSASYWTGHQDRVVELRAGKQFRFDLDAMSRFSLGEPPSRLVDLLRIASSIYVVDRLVKRHTQNGPNHPSRALGLRVSVLDQAFWNRPEVRDALGEAVDFVSGDFWDIDFAQDSSSFSRIQRLLPNPSEGETPLLCLYSGGLDSAAGLVSRIAENPDRSVIPVTVWHQPRQRHLLKQQYDILRGRFQTQIDPLIVKVAMGWTTGLEKKQQEQSQRGRSFLFLAIGAIAAIMQGQHSVELFESGIGAINLPLMAGMVSSKATRSSHPEFLRLMSRLVSLVADTEIEFSLPFFSNTKGEVTKKLAELGLQDLAVLTASCVGYPLRHSKAKQCGVCPACLFRRQAMHVAGIPEPDHSYKHDLFAPPFLFEPVSLERLNYLKAFLMQVAQLNNVEHGEQLPRAFERHVVGTGILQRGQSQKGLIDLLVRYRDEWMTIATHARRYGHGWARWLAPQQSQGREQGVTYASA
jgi:7-cyano-7-deazaguanine synthase in queuosine biosynthesis